MGLSHSTESYARKRIDTLSKRIAVAEAVVAEGRPNDLVYYGSRVMKAKDRLKADQTTLARWTTKLQSLEYQRNG